MNKYASTYIKGIRAALNSWNPLSMTSSLQKAVPKTMLVGGVLNAGNTAIRDFDMLENQQDSEYYKKVILSLINGAATGAAAPLVIPTGVHAVALARGVPKAYKVLTQEHKIVKKNIEDFLKREFNMPVQTPPKS